MNALPFPREILRENEPLAPLTLYRIGGPARMALFPRTRDEAAAAYAWLAARPGRKMILGGGSNVLINDEGFPGIVLVTAHLTGMGDLGANRWDINAGEVLDALVRVVMLAHNYAGVGGLTGIPGSVGGAIYMNAGTANGTICPLLETVDLVDAAGRRNVWMEEPLYGYRGQTFCPEGGLILGATFQFEGTDEPQQPIYDRYIARRKEKQPQGYCCGSVFKNPPGEHAGRLIESCGLKGTRRGGAVISPMHANFIMNDDGAAFADVEELIELCKAKVYAKHGILLDEEVRIIR